MDEPLSPGHNMREYMQQEKEGRAFPPKGEGGHPFDSVRPFAAATDREEEVP